MKYIHKPVVIEAFKLGSDTIPDWFMDAVSADTIRIRGQWRDLQSCSIKTLEEMPSSYYIEKCSWDEGARITDILLCNTGHPYFS